MKRFTTTVAAAGFVLAGFATTASAQNYVVQAWTFVGTSAECAPSPAGRKIVTSQWLNGMGLPDNGTAHPAAAAKDIHSGLLLSKHGPTPNCSSAGAQVIGWTPGAPLNSLGFDVRKGGACGAGAPRFYVVATGTLTVHVFGCAHGQSSPAPQDGANWDRVSFDTAGGPYPGDNGFVFGTQVDEIHIIFDEGTDTATPGNPSGIGLTVLDNIKINNTLVTKKKGNPILP